MLDYADYEGGSRSQEKDTQDVVFELFSHQLPEGLNLS